VRIAPFQPGRWLSLGTVTLTALATACTSATSGAGTTIPAASSTPTIATRPSSSSATPAPPAATAGELGSLLRTGIASERTAHLVVSISQGGGALIGSADERLSGGTSQDLRITQQVGAGITYRVLVIGHKAYAMLPAFYRTSRPWVVVSRNSSVAAVRQLAKTLPGVRATGSPATLVRFAASAQRVRALGVRDVGGVRTTAYEVDLETAKLPATVPAKAQLQAAGIAAFPIEIDVDAAGRSVRVLEAVKVGGVLDSTSVVWSRFNRPVSITAPPPSQVGPS
jgi:hypothetical protein